MNQFEGVFEVFGLTVRRLANGHKTRLVLECEENIDIERSLIEFRGENIKAKIIQAKPEDQKSAIYVETVFEVFDIKCRRLRNGDKLSLTLEQLYEKENELKLVKLRFDEVNIFMEKIDEDLFDKDDESDDDEPEIEDSEGEK